jgi:hypothetical protein
MVDKGGKNTHLKEKKKQPLEQMLGKLNIPMYKTKTTSLSLISCNFDGTTGKHKGNTWR